MTIHYNYDTSPWIKMPVKELTTPKPGRICKGPAYWAVTPDDCVLFYKTYNSPQCNIHRSIVKRLTPGDDMEVRWIEVAFVPHNCSDFC